MMNAIKLEVMPAQNKKEIISFTPSSYTRQGVFNILLGEQYVGTVDISRHTDEIYVSVKIKDMFLTIDQISSLINNLKNKFRLSSHQKVSFQQV